MGRVSWITPRREHEGAEKRETEHNQTADEKAGDMVVGPETTAMGFKDGDNPQDHDHRRQLDAAEGKRRSPRQSLQKEPDQQTPCC